MPVAADAAAGASGKDEGVTDAEPMPPILNDPQHTAIHEAGHAVIGRLVGMACGGATIVADDDSAGHGIVADPWITVGAWEERGKFRDVRSVMVGRIITFLAGAVAEQECLGRCEGGDVDDLWQVALMLDATGWPKRSGDELADRDHYLARLRAQTRKLVRHHRQPIERVAGELLRLGSLEPGEIDGLLTAT